MLTDSRPLEDLATRTGTGTYFDVFLSHSSRDKPVVERIAERLKRARVEPWLDSWHLVAGTDWQRGLAEGLAASRSCAVFVGPSDLGAWENQEVAVALDRAASDPTFRLFLVLLPGLPERFDAAELLPFLRMRTWVDYRKGLDDERAFRALVSAIQGLPVGPAVPLDADSEVCPYRGLEAFEEEHRAFFFGREADVQRLLEKLKGTRFLAVLGASGSGKSSLVRAGLVPKLKDASGGADWEVAILRPGAHPLEALAVQLLRLGADSSMQQTVDALASDQRIVHFAASLALAERPFGSRLLLVLDQFEEVFTLCRDDDERRALFANLLYAATVPGGTSCVLLAMRSDFYHRCGSYPELAQQVAAQQYLVSPLQPEGLRQAVEDPARLVGLQFEPGLVETILEDVADQPGALPLLEHALLEVWRRRAGGVLTLAAYRESGGVQAALGKRAEQIFASLPAGQQQRARRAFLRLSQPGDGAEDTRRRANVSELGAADADAEVATVLTRLIDARLLTASRDEASGEDVVEIAHEALIRGWPRLRSWIDEDRAGLRVHRRLTEAAREWERLNHDASVLYRGARLAEAREWRAENEEALNTLERDFLAASLKAEQDELEQARRRTRRLRALALALAVLLAAAIGAAAFAKQQTDTANAQRRTAEQATRSARSLVFAAASRDQIGRHVDAALLLGLEAVRMQPGAEARSSMTLALQTARQSGANAILRGETYGVLSGTTNGITALAVSGDGRKLVSGNGLGFLRFWDARAGRALGPPRRAHQGRVTDLAFSPNGRMLISAGGDRVQVWDVRTQKIRGRLRGVQRSARGLTFSSDGRMVAGGNSLEDAQIWDVRTREPIGPPLRPDVVVGDEGDFSIRLTAFSYDGTQLATADGTRTVRVWNLIRRVESHRYYAGSDPLALAFSPDGRTLVAADASNVVRTWNLRTDESRSRRLRGHRGDQSAAVLGDDAHMLVTAGSDGTVRVWDTPTGKQLGHTLPGHTGSITSVAFSADTGVLASGSADKTVRLWNHRTHKPLGQPLPSADSYNVGVALSGRFVAAPSYQGIRLWDVRSQQELEPLAGDEGSVHAVASSPAGPYIASAEEDNRIRIWDLRTRHQIGDPLTGITSAALAFSPDGKTLATGGSGREIARLWNVDTHQIRHRFFDQREEDPGYEGGLNSVAFSPDGKLLLTHTEYDESVRVWDANTFKKLATLPGAGGAFAADSRTVATTGGAVRIWTLDTYEPIGQPFALDAPAVSYSPDRRTVATGHYDGTIRIWDVSTRQQLGRTLTATSATSSDLIGTPVIQFSADGRTLAASSRDGDGEVRLFQGIFWRDLADLRAQVCGLVSGNLTEDEWEELVPGVPYRRTCGE